VNAIAAWISCGSSIRKVASSTFGSIDTSDWCPCVVIVRAGSVAGCTSRRRGCRGCVVAYEHVVVAGGDDGGERLGDGGDRS
jgi:hypothetical protein